VPKYKFSINIPLVKNHSILQLIMTSQTFLTVIIDDDDDDDDDDVLPPCCT
jgi:hypothetical protein